jgi:hypothetical protein
MEKKKSKTFDGFLAAAAAAVGSAEARFATRCAR